MTPQQINDLQRLRDWHNGQASTYRKLAPVTAMDHPELTTTSFHATADWHEKQVVLLDTLLKEQA